MLKVGLFTDTYFPQVNGVATSTATLKRNLELLGYQVYVFTTTNPLAPAEEDSIYRIPSAPFVSGHRIAKFYETRLVNEIKALNLDIIHTHTEFSIGIFGRLVAKKLNIPRVHTYHTIYEDYTHYVIKYQKVDHISKNLARKMSKTFCNSAAAVITPTEKVRTLLRTYGVNKEMTVIPTGISLEKFQQTDLNLDTIQAKRLTLGIKENEKVILYIGRISKEKNIEELFHHLQSYLKEKADATFVLVGDGPEKENLEALAITLEIQDQVKFVGEVPWTSVMAYYQMGDVFVSASQSETQGLTYIEALASGLPVVAKKDPCLEGVVENGINGYTFENQQEFLQALESIFNNPNHQAQLAINAAASTDKFSEYIFAENVARLYHETLQTTVEMVKNTKDNQHDGTDTEAGKPTLKYKILMTSVILIATTVLFLLNASRWVSNSGVTSFEQVIFNLRAPRDGVSADIVWNFIWESVPSVFLVTMLAILIFIRSLRWKTKLQRRLLTLFAAGTVLLTVLTWNFVRIELHVQAFLENQQIDSTFIEDHYVSPTDVTLTFPEVPRNLIHIYLESMEVTFMSTSDGGALEVDLIPELTDLARENVNFSQSTSDKIGGAVSTINTTWTSASMFAQTAGLPLNMPVRADSALMDALLLTYEDIPLFPSGAMTLGEILEEQGYRQVIMMGSDATFGGRRYYFTQNGNYEIWDHHTAIHQGLLPEDYHEWWGFEDEHLFNFAKDMLIELGESDQPFNFTMLTADTHFEDGFLSPACDEPFEIQYANVLTCSSRMIGDFISWIKDQPFYDNTTIVITGDHPTMQSADSDFWEAFPVSEDYQRTVYHAFINPATSPVTTANRSFTTIDFFPTTLASLGVEIEGERLGLGTNLFSSEPTLLEQFGLEEMNQELQRRSVFFEEMMKATNVQ